MTAKPLSVVVSLLISSIISLSAAGWGYNGTGLPEVTGIQGDALSSDPPAKPQRPTPSAPRTIIPLQAPREPAPKSHSIRPSPKITAPEPSSPRIRTRSTDAIPYSGSTRAAIKEPSAVPVQASAPPTPLSSLCGMFGQGGSLLASVPCGPGLPRPGCKQFQVDARLWYGRLNSTTIQWGTIPGGYRATELDLNNNLGLRAHEYIPEFEGRCQFKSNWALKYTFMPIHYRDNFTNWTPFWFGNLLWPVGAMLTEWDRNVHTWDLVYSWFQAPHAVASVFMGYRLHDDRLKVSYPIYASVGWTRTRSQGIHLADAGVSLDRLISRVGGCATASMHCKWSMQFLEGYLGWDAYGVGRIAVPMNQGRYGYMEAGWKWIVLQNNQHSNLNKTSLDGAIAAVGFIF